MTKINNCYFDDKNVKNLAKNIRQACSKLFDRRRKHNIMLNTDQISVTAYYFSIIVSHNTKGI